MFSKMPIHAILLASLVLILTTTSCANQVSLPDGLQAALDERTTAAGSETSSKVSTAKQSVVNLLSLGARGVTGLIGVTEVWCVTLESNVTASILAQPFPDGAVISSENLYDNADIVPANRLVAFKRSGNWEIYSPEAYDWSSELLCD